MTIKPDSQIASPTEVQSVLGRLEEWRAQLRQGQIKSRLHLGAPPTPDPSLERDLRHLGIKDPIDTPAAAEAVGQGIKQWLAAAPVVHLTFSAPLSPANRRVILEWLRQQLDPQLLADFRTDGTIAAGFALRTRNRIYNFTSNHTLWQHRAKISELVRRV